MKAETSFSLKDQLFNQAKVDYLASLILQVYPDFKAKAFCKKVVAKFPQLELKKDEHIKLAKKHPMRLMTTRRLYEGEHNITLQINGASFDNLSFELLE